ncbi:hypothetical protein ACH5RR_012549 [Cinchona calisaya]|uniref:RNase H type-1 domain-containing protein n=1 Tax=Cinchona calisaya TaxID=153742 RepID=A0ABD3A8L2_9GENT
MSEMDSKALVDIVNQKLSTPLKLDGLLQQIQDLLSPEHFVLQHVYRKANSVADLLSKEGSSNREFLLHSSDVPSFISGCIFLDSLGIPYARLGDT